MAGTSEKRYYVIGSTHIDLAWKKSQEELAEHFEVFLLRLLDLLDTEKSFTYVLEQAAHLRNLSHRRSDLINRVKSYLNSGRLEFVGGMASTMETNIPNGESFIRNQLLGISWVEKNLGAAVKTGWLVDTFGLNPQIPQVLRQFGIEYLFADRLGSQLHLDHFIWESPDGSQIKVVGVDVGYPCHIRDKVYFAYVEKWEGIDKLFDEASSAVGNGPFLVMPYTENETLPSKRIIDHVHRYNKAGDEKTWVFSLPSQYLEVLERSRPEWRLVRRDLNPEFTGTFSNRSMIRLRNRSVETLLLEAEKWSVLLDTEAVGLRDSWWIMAFNQFHDVLTGSHPTAIFQEVLANYDSAQRTAEKVLSDSFAAAIAGEGKTSDTVGVWIFNGLPWERTDGATIELPPGWSGAEIFDRDEKVPVIQNESQITFLASAPSVGFKSYVMRTSSAQKNTFETVRAAMIENEFVRLEGDTAIGIRRIVDKQTNRTLLEDCGDFLIVQEDRGSFQIEEPFGSEIAAEAGTMNLEVYPKTSVCERLQLSGRFPSLPWAGADNHLSWRLTCTAFQGKPRLDLSIELDWLGEASRIRFKIPTTLNASDGLYEVPFAVVPRKPYGRRTTARGEWPAHRFVAIEAEEQGIALVNTGCCGVEVNGGTILTTFLRAPWREYVGMIPDDTSSQHGVHHLQLSLVPYSGSCERWKAVQMAQEMNTPFHIHLQDHWLPDSSINRSFLRLEPCNLVLSAVKRSEEGDDLIVRFYETIGMETQAELFIENAARAWYSDVGERRGAELVCQNGRISLGVKPFQIVTLRITRSRS